MPPQVHEPIIGLPDFSYYLDAGMDEAVNCIQTATENGAREILRVLDELKAKDSPDKIVGRSVIYASLDGRLNLNIHIHQLFGDGCYEINDQGEPTEFWTASPPTVKEIDQVSPRSLLSSPNTWKDKKSSSKTILMADSNSRFQMKIHSLNFKQLL